MDLFVYSDESGVFDKAHNDSFVFGGLVFLSKQDRDIWSRKYAAAERVIRDGGRITAGHEIKATTVSNKDKNKLYRSLNNAHKFGVIVRERFVLDSIFQNKKSKQRYLDYAYKIAVKRKFERMIASGLIDPNEVEHISFFVDEHTTATDGRYELRECLEQEFRFGTYNFNYSIFYEPIFPKLKDVQVEFCNSASKTLVRAADIVSNKLFFIATHGEDIPQSEFFSVIKLP